VKLFIKSNENIVKRISPSHQKNVMEK